MRIERELFPTSREIFSWVNDLSRLEHRRTGTLEGRQSAEYIASKMKEFGLEDVKIESVPSICLSVKDDYSLTIDGEALECFYANGTHHKELQGTFSIGENGEKQDFIYLKKGLKEDFQNVDVEGKIVVCSIDFPSGSPVDMLGWNENSEVYDPDEKIKPGIKKADIYSPNNWPYNYFYAIQNGAAGFVGILEDYFDDPYWYCEDYTEIGQQIGVESMSIPGMWISKSTGEILKKKFAEKEILLGNMKMTSTYEYKDALNVSGKLYGESDDIILIHSHHDAVFRGAVQDASGVGTMLSIAKFFAENTTVADRKKTMMFAAMDSHYTDYMGHQGFIAARKANDEKLILDITLEHIGKEVALDENNELSETGDIETRVCYVSKSSNLYDYVKQTIKEYELKKTIFFPVQDKSISEGVYNFKQDEIITDAYYFNENDIPVISYISGPVYLFHPSDTPDRVPIDELQPVGMAFAEIAMEAGNRL